MVHGGRGEGRGGAGGGVEGSLAGKGVVALWFCLCEKRRRCVTHLQAEVALPEVEGKGDDGAIVEGRGNGNGVMSGSKEGGGVGIGRKRKREEQERAGVM